MDRLGESVVDTLSDIPARSDNVNVVVVTSEGEPICPMRSSRVHAATVGCLVAQDTGSPPTDQVTQLRGAEHPGDAQEHGHGGDPAQGGGGQPFEQGELVVE